MVFSVVFTSRIQNSENNSGASYIDQSDHSSPGVFLQSETKNIPFQVINQSQRQKSCKPAFLTSDYQSAYTNGRQARHMKTLENVLYIYSIIYDRLYISHTLNP